MSVINEGWPLIIGSTISLGAGFIIFVIDVMHFYFWLFLINGLLSSLLYSFIYYLCVDLIIVFMCGLF